MSKYTKQRKDAENEISKEKLESILKHFKVLLKRRASLSNDLRDVDIELGHLEDKGYIKAEEVKGGGVTNFNWVGTSDAITTTTGATALSIDMGS